MKWPRVVVILCLCVLSGCPKSGQQPLSAEELAWREDVAQEGEVVVVPTGERQLFLDDYIIAELNNLTRTMHQPDKKGAVIKPSQSEGEVSLQTRSAPAWDPEAQAFKLVVTEGTSTIWQSQDGLHWSRQGKTNVPFYCMVYDGTDPDPAHRYKAFWAGNVYVSPDGLTWTKLDVLQIPCGDEANLSFDEKEHLFIATVKHGGLYGRSHALTTSTDFEHWTEPELIFGADELDQELARKNIAERFADSTLHHPPYNIPAHYGVDVYNMGVFRYEGLYIGMPAMFYHTGTVRPDWEGFTDVQLCQQARDYIAQYGDYTGFFDIQLACSRDLRNWTRLGDREPFIGPSPVGTGAYDRTTLLPPSNALVRGDELWFYYTGGKSYSIFTAANASGMKPDWYAICLAVLRRDGFISLDAGEEAGSIITKTLRIPEGAQRLFVNVDAPEGELRAVILDAAGQPLAGFTVPQVVPVPGGTTHTYPLPLYSNPINGDHTRAEVTWQGHSDLSVLAGQDVRIRFRLCQGRFYSFWFE